MNMTPWCDRPKLLPSMSVRQLVHVGGLVKVEELSVECVPVFDTVVAVSCSFVSMGGFSCKLCLSFYHFIQACVVETTIQNSVWSSSHKIMKFGSTLQHV